MKVLGVMMMLLLGSSAFATQTVTCKGKAVTGEEFQLSFCFVSNFERCESRGVEISVNGKAEEGYYPQDVYVNKVGDGMVAFMKSLDDGLQRYAELEYSTTYNKRWNLLRFRLIKANPKSDEQIEKTYFTATDFTCDLKP